MRRHYEELARFEREGFDIVVETTPDDSHPGDYFDDSCYDIKDMCLKIDRGVYVWFMLRVRIQLAGVDLAEEYLSGLLYEDAREVLTDGLAEDLIYSGIANARVKAQDLVRSFQRALDTEVV